MSILTEYPKYATMQRASRTQNMHQKTEWVFVYFEKNIVRSGVG